MGALGTNGLICTANLIADFYVKCNTGLKYFNEVKATFTAAKGPKVWKNLRNFSCFYQ